MMMNYPQFKDVKQFYEWGCYTNEQVGEYVKFDTITPEQYQEITGEAYQA